MSSCFEAFHAMLQDLFLLILKPEDVYDVRLLLFNTLTDSSLQSVCCV